MTDLSNLRILESKTCAECGHRVQKDGLDLCGATNERDLVSGEFRMLTCFAARLGTLPRDCGKQAVHFVRAENHEALRRVKREKVLRDIEEAITQVCPNAVEASDSILAALSASLKKRHEQVYEQIADDLDALIDRLYEIEGLGAAVKPYEQTAPALAVAS